MGVRLDTSSMMDRIKDEIDSLVSIGAVGGSNVDKFTDDARIFIALNNADRNVCNELEIETHLIFFLSSGVSDKILSERSDGEHSDHIDAAILGSAKQLYLDIYPHANVSEIRSNSIFLYENYPLGDVRPDKEIKLTSRDDFAEESPSMATINDNQVYDNFAMFDPFANRLRFKNSFDKDYFVEFQGYVKPKKIDKSSVDSTMISNYKMMSPEFAEDYFMVLAMKDILPYGSEIRANIVAEEEAERRRAINRIPHDTTPIRLNSKYSDNATDW